MHSLRSILSASLVASSFAVAPTLAETLPQAPRLEAVVTSALHEFGVPGAAIGVWTPDGHWTMTAGLADVASHRPVTRGDHFGIRSITKSFTVTLVMQLVAASVGTISLDDPIAKYLHGIPNGEKITLRQLGDMTSGLFDYTRDTGFGEALGADLTRPWTADELLAFAFDGSSHPQTNFDPGTRYQYSNTNTLVLGKLVEVLTGRSFEDVLADQILLPLRLDATSFVVGTRLPRPSVEGYQGFDADGLPENLVVSFSGLGFAGAMVSTLQDLAEWSRVVTLGKLLPADLQAQRFIAHPTADDPGSPLYDAYGLGIGQLAGWWGHTGSGIGFQAAVFHQNDRQETFVVLLNASNVDDVPARIFCRVLDVLNESPDPSTGSICVPGSPRLDGARHAIEDEALGSPIPAASGVPPEAATPR